MKISLKSVKLDAALEAVNGRAVRHTFRYDMNVRWSLESAEELLTKYGLPKKHWQGAVVTLESGDKLPNAYKQSYSVIRTRVIVERLKTAWAVTDIQRIEGDHDPITIRLTAEQIDIASKAHAKRYNVVQSG